jgi:hypothetical protein
VFYPPVGKSVVKVDSDIVMVMWGCPILLIPHVLISIEKEIGLAQLSQQ